MYKYISLLLVLILTNSSFAQEDVNKVLDYTLSYRGLSRQDVTAPIDFFDAAEKSPTNNAKLILPIVRDMMINPLRSMTWIDSTSELLNLELNKVLLKMFTYNDFYQFPNPFAPVGYTKPADFQDLENKVLEFLVRWRGIHSHLTGIFSLEERKFLEENIFSIFEDTESEDDTNYDILKYNKQRDTSIYISRKTMDILSKLNKDWIYSYSKSEFDFCSAMYSFLKQDSKLKGEVTRIENKYVSGDFYSYYDQDGIRIAIGGPGGWAQPRDVVPNLVRDKWKFDIKTVSYKDLGELIKQAKADNAAVQRARQRAEAYLKAPGNTLETKREYVDNCFLLEQVFRGIMKEADCQAITINGCMGTIMPIAETSACMTLSLLNDGQYLAFCESDFVVIPSGVLLANISGNPVFLNDPTCPHDGMITLAHCTAPRKMNGKEMEPVRIMTHFESDYGAAPKVEMRKGQTITTIVPDFKAERWVGLLAEIIEAPFMDVCRSQIDVRYKCDDLKLAERMPGFHWMVGYGDYLKEMGYALKKVGIKWENLTA